MTGAEAGPYVGLRYYRVDDADRFFGRSRETWELTELLLSSRLVVVYGSSGVGKTSLLHAGVLAELGPDRAHVLPVGRPPQTSAFPTAEAPDYNPFTFAVLSGWAPDSGPGAIRGLTVSQFLQGIPVGSDRYGEPLPLIAIIDQFEEVFADVPQWAFHREEFLDQLAQAVREVKDLRLLVALRADAVGELLPYESRLSGGDRKRYRVEPLDRAAALEAVTEPLQSTSRSFAPGVAEALVDRLRTTTITNAVGEQRTIQSPTVEPVNLQMVCWELWQALPDDVTTITNEHVQYHGDVKATLMRFCKRAVEEVAEQEGVPEPAIWDWLGKTFITDLGTRGAAYEGIASTNGMLNTVARALEDKRILRSEKRSGSVWFELLHDGLIEPIKLERLAEGFEAEPDPGARTREILRMAETALAEGALARAEEYARLAIRASEHDQHTHAEATSFLGKLTFDRGRSQGGDRAEELYTAAEEYYRRAAELFETERDSSAVARVLALLGQLYRERGRIVDAVDVLQSAINREPSDLDLRLDLHMDLARALSDSGQPMAALAQYGSLLTVAPERTEALVERGKLNAQHGDPVLAMVDLDDAIRRQPELADRADVALARRQAVSRQERRF